MPYISLSGSPLHPPQTAGNATAALTLSLSMTVFVPEEATTNQSATRTVIFNPDGWEPECFFQLAQLLEAEYHADRMILVQSLRAVADALERASDAKEQRA